MTHAYIIAELQNLASMRKGVLIQASSLANAKRAASRSQLFQGTVVTVSDAQGNRLSTKIDGIWIDSLAVPSVAIPGAPRLHYAGVGYTLTSEATRTNRVFPGWWGDAKDGDKYTSEFSATAQNDAGETFIVVWQFEQVQGAEVDDDCLDWVDICSVHAA